MPPARIALRFAIHFFLGVLCALLDQGIVTVLKACAGLVGWNHLHAGTIFAEASRGIF